MRLIKWEFGINEKMYSTEICGKKWCLAKGQWDGLLFHIAGMGLTKSERRFFSRKFLEYGGHLNIYLGKWMFSWHEKGVYYNFRAVDITFDRKIYLKRTIFGIPSIIRLAKEQGLKFAILYELGLAEVEGISSIIR